MSITIIKPGRFIEAEVPEIRIGMEGWFTLQAKNRYGRIRRERQFPTHNLITDLGLNRIGEFNAEQVYRYCHVGLGTAVPDPTDVQLANFLANLQGGQPSSTSGNSGSPDYFSWRRFEWTSSIGALGNNNLTEVGVSGQSTNGLLFSRDLIKDSGGNPSVFPIQDDEQLTVIYELRFYPPLGDTLATVSVGPNSHDTITRARNISGNSFLPQTSSGSQTFVRSSSQQLACSGNIVLPTDNLPGGERVSASGGGTADYSNGDLYRDMWNSWNSGTGAITARTVLFNMNSAAFQCQFDPAIEKSGDQTLILDQRISWGRR